MEFEVLYQDEDLIAINKPNGILVHKTSIAADATEFALQILRKQIGQKVYPGHRLDRKTSGVLIFGKNPEAGRLIQMAFMEQVVQKKYLAIVRGYFPEEVDLSYSITNDRNKEQEAQTLFKCLEQTELDIPLGLFQTSRYSLVEVSPKTGRQHQIRKHLKHLRHNIIGDRPYGCNKQNRFFKERWNMTTMLLHALELELIHPLSQKPLLITAKPSPEFYRMLNTLEFRHTV